jgi:hypothetical protein
MMLHRLLRCMFVERALENLDIIGHFAVPRCCPTLLDASASQALRALSQY